jgi:hypothetical protein
MNTKFNNLKTMLIKGSLATLCIMSLSACSKKDVITATESVEETTSVAETTEDYSVDNDNIMVDDFASNDSGIKNPQNNFREEFGWTDVESTSGSGMLTGMPSEQDRMKEIYGDNYDLIVEYEAKKYGNLSDDLITRLHEKGFDYDSDSDGLLDYDEITIYHSNPNKKSTSGDVYSDGYKVGHNMDINSVNESTWVEVDDLVSMYPESANAYTCATYDLNDSYLKAENLYLLEVSMYYEGKIRVDLSKLNLKNPVVEVYNIYDVTHKAISVEGVGNGVVEFHIDKGYNDYLIHEEDFDVDGQIQYILDTYY